MRVAAPMEARVYPDLSAVERYGSLHARNRIVEAGLRRLRLRGTGTGFESLREWEPGDAFERLDHTGPEKVKSLFQEHRVLLWDRRHWPVVVSGKEIVWVRRFGAASKFSARNGTARVLRLIFEPNRAESGSP